MYIDVVESKTDKLSDDVSILRLRIDGYRIECFSMNAYSCNLKFVERRLSGERQ